MVAFRKHIPDGKKRFLKCSSNVAVGVRLHCPENRISRTTGAGNTPPADNQDHPCEVAGESTVWSFFI